MIELIIGGARSGKSAHALSLAEARDADLHFVATAQPADDEMAARIERHQRQRGARWNLIEEPRYLSRITEHFGETDVLLVDCLTLWLSNWLCSDMPKQGHDQGHEQWHEKWHEEKQNFQHGLQQSAAHWLLVSNEVGMGVTPTNRLSRQFIDESGWLHQELAQIASRVTTMTHGIPHLLKS
ncbi:bifunctional adenosylcobinamide kinase/adenosylcobinamide-phosphate guanylyltransferase [Candidatus Spongiihabitans sp.]|uniref:bifunctional adenosylcobinamide kinase/adenosylcobinamide-phosphate guanylyltransferase n=1 Tax=Candidatus Spongiihabitans sp. TaxID=3101308 RepID=UPI003C79DA99